jgi:hypothetical protein
MESEWHVIELDEIRAQVAAHDRERQKEINWLYTRQSAAEEFMEAIGSGNFEVF